MRGLFIVAGLAVLAVGAAVAADEPPPPISSLDEIRSAAMPYCAEMWTKKTHAELSEVAQLSNILLVKQRNDANDRAKALEKKAQEIQVKIDAQEKINDKTLEDAGASLGNTIMSSGWDAAKEGVKTAAKDAENTAEIGELQKLRSELASIEYQALTMRAMAAGIETVAKTVNECLVDQEKYLGPAPADPNALTLPPKPGAKKMAGTWWVKCRNKEDGILESDGAFELDFALTGANPAEATVGGTLVMDKDTVALSGTWYKNVGQVRATATMMERPWMFTGAVQENAGQLVSAGDVAGSFGEYTCNGKYNGQEK